MGSTNLYIVCGHCMGSTNNYTSRVGSQRVMSCQYGIILTFKIAHKRLMYGRTYSFVLIS